MFKIVSQAATGLALAAWSIGCGGSSAPKDVSRSYAPSPAYQPPPQYAPPAYNQPGPRYPAAGTLACLNVSWRDSTGELQQLAAGMSQAEAVALGLSVVLTGADWYAARVQLANTGNTAIRVFPENIAMHFGQDSAGVTTIDHPQFLRRGVVQPGYYVEGLVMFRARVDIGAMIRLGGGRLSYSDASIRVTYN